MSKQNLLVLFSTTQKKEAVFAFETASFSF